MLIVPVQAVPNQTFSILLGNQSCQITLTTRQRGLYMTLAVSNQGIITNVVCQNLNRMVRYAYLNFIGDFWFTDTQGKTDPVYSGLNSRYLLEYWEASDVAAAALAA